VRPTQRAPQGKMLHLPGTCNSDLWLAAASFKTPAFGPAHMISGHAPQRKIELSESWYKFRVDRILFAGQSCTVAWKEEVPRWNSNVGCSDCVRAGRPSEQRLPWCITLAKWIVTRSTEAYSSSAAGSARVQGPGFRVRVQGSECLSDFIRLGPRSRSGVRRK